MPAPLKKQYHQLVNKYLDGTATPNEIQTVELYYNLFSDEEDVTKTLSPEMIDQIGTRMQGNIKQRIKQVEKRVIPLPKRTWFRVAAILLLVSAAATVFYIQNKKQFNTLTNNHVKHIYPNLNRYITLTDGSKIVLHSGSHIQIANNFNTAGTREVSLTGEAYFDIKHDSKRPFIIHTGNVKTTVLGTAFNIKAYPGQKNIIVTVTRGRVRVENEHTVLAILTPNQQVTYNETDQKAARKKVVAIETLSWAKTDMSFDGMPFGDLADRLDQRYGVNIKFRNPGLASCPITGRFTGTESLTEVLDILSQTRNTTYKIMDNEVVIDGKGCN